MKIITGYDAMALNYSARHNTAPPKSWRKMLTKSIAEMLYDKKKREASRTLKAMRKVAEQNALLCKPKRKKVDDEDDDDYGSSPSGSLRDDPPNYDKPIYDRHGNQIGTIYDPPPMPGPSGLS